MRQALNGGRWWPTVPMRIIVCTFATAEYAGSAELLRHTALREGDADQVIVYREADVAPWFDDNPRLLRGQTRGYGWWSWKPWCIRETLRRHAAPDDVVVYCDAAMIFETSLRPYVEAVRHVLLFRLGGWTTNDYRNRCWTKRDTFGMMGMADDEHRDAIQLNAAVQMYRHTPRAFAFLQRYVDWCARHEVIDDARMLEDYPGYKDHRHDQSILSLLAVGCEDVAVARDPTQYGTDDPHPTDSPTPPPGLLHHHRARRRPVPVAVITPTVGGPHLEACVRSVQAQDLPNVRHYVVVDGPQAESAVDAVLAKFRNRGVVHVLRLPHNTGAGGWNGHRIYAALPALCDAHFVAFLDEDNEYDTDHLRHLVKAAAGAKVQWAHSLRRIVDQDGADVCPDNCESLGGITHTVCGRGDHLVDTSCFLLHRDLAIRTAHCWNVRARDPSGREPDRELTRALLDTPHAVVRRHSVRYRVGSTGLSVRAPFFVDGNRRLGYDFARFRDVYVFHFSPETTRAFLECRRDDTRSHALDEWQMSMLRGLDGRPGAPPDERFNLLDGYACADRIPPGAVVYVSMCMPDQVPWDLLRRRTDVWRVGYTAESPNIRHAKQWDPVLLGSCFDVVLTYWKPLLEDGRVRTVFCPHNTHHLDLDDPVDRAQLRVNRGGEGASCAMVLERRDLQGEYEVPNVPVRLRCLDGLRESLVRDLRDVTVFGQGWDVAAARHPGIKLGHALHRSRDPRHAVDILQNYNFAVIVENCDAEWYASEKLYDALMAGCVPLYYGSVPPHLDIPEGLDGAYLDVKKLGDSAAIQTFLDTLTPDRIAAWKARVAELRPAILRRVGTVAFADAFRAALGLR